MERAGIAGPLFISVGQPDQLRKFLDINPELEECPALIDTSADYAGYRAAGFTNLLGESVPETPPDFKPPKTMGGMKWLSCAAAIRRRAIRRNFADRPRPSHPLRYLRNVATLSPAPPGGLKFGGPVPTGVKVLGGTYAVVGDDVTFAHEDAVPGATPEIDAVLAAAGVRDGVVVPVRP